MNGLNGACPPPSMSRFQLLAAGALGDYQAMDEALATIEPVLRQEVAKNRGAVTELAKACVPHFFEAGAEPSAVGLRYTLAVRTLPTLLRFRDSYLASESMKGELCNNITLHGIILLEAGETKRARTFFQMALAEGKAVRSSPIARSRAATSNCSNSRNENHATGEPKRRPVHSSA